MAPSACDKWVPYKVGRTGPSAIPNSIGLYKPDSMKPMAHVEIRKAGNYAQKGLYLPPSLSWAIVRDSEGYPVLVWKEKS